MGKINIVILGPQGSGKGTQAQAIAKKYNLSYFETGGELRKLAISKTALGKKITQKINNGLLVENKIIKKTVEQFIKNNSATKGVIFDGFPRTIAQYKIKNTLDRKYSLNKTITILLNLPIAISRARIQSRRICERCHKIITLKNDKQKFCQCKGRLLIRKDDTAPLITKRLEIYQKEIAPVIKTYKLNNNLIEIDGRPPIPQVTKTILAQIEKEVDVQFNKN